jgi:hypothetical protein
LALGDAAYLPPTLATARAEDPFPTPAKGR